jgi:hypothetical protein
MKKPAGLWHLFGLLALALLFVLPTTASAATTVRVFPTPHSSAFSLPAPAPPPVTIGPHATVRLAVVPGYPAAGTQAASPGLDGTTVVLASCARTCTDNYRPASSPAIPARHYEERVTFTVTQPARTGTVVGFDVDIAVHVSTGWVFGVGYFSTGLGTRAVTSTITLRLFVDMGAAAPTVLSVEVTVNACLTASACP